MFVRFLLNHIFQILDLILGNIRLSQFLQELVGISADIPDSHLGGLPLLLDILYQFFSPFLRKLREYQADHFAVVGRINPQIGHVDRLLNGLHHGGLPGLYLQDTGLRNADISHLLQGGGGSVIVHLYLLKHVGISSACPDRTEFLHHVPIGFVHLFRVNFDSLIHVTFLLVFLFPTPSLSFR